ncbi:MAG: ArsR family transcriptional regulator [Pseudomonadales bacterium]|jgi:2-polyprenyl-3-methyl-5-hydroxy-6-metoxy-1,4-benzoquinol methylase|nr:ArsR family transcriptional regulator [Pseudomonadales bacterium]MEC8810219.1 metalloregulator ArsR/SmtB family transcription factor [Pseudomonadota bacterium]TNC88931.1 MAG: ArsR family transcriptional regulator [Alcanivorax sp.]HAG96399.1 ArsR family transcriptional regulator [Gammaproteobacteria bacterium]HBO93222.1 ArsR family transcriptional regulator [Gammaproteobacteria bacterium]|tara:strand:- start:21890 stop:22876 length:987 start_codon:yes stop_codon:yes gene_type:complete
MNAGLPPITADQLTSLAQLCKGTGDPLRLEILRSLRTDSFGVMELCEIFDTKQPAMSHHLKVLAKAGAVTTRREGNSIFYRRMLADISIPQGQLLAALYSAIDQVALSDGTATRIDAIKQEREEVAREFFDRHAEQFREQQELIALFDQYAESVRDLLLQTNPHKGHTALEIGPGEGAFLSTLADLFQQVTAIDISREMLDKAETVRRQQALDNVQLLQADTEDAVQQGIHVDRIVCNMVLHHVPSPADVFEDCAQLLNADGALIVADLCRHDQDWAKQSCGDLWLGFDPEELTDWANDAGLVSTDSLYVGLRNGFQIQVRRFDKPNS